MPRPCTVVRDADHTLCFRARRLSSHAPRPSAPRPISIADAGLVARIRAGDVSAFEALHAEHHAALWRFAYDHVRASDAAEEIVQEVFLSVWRKRGEWEVASSVAGWLYGAVRHHALRHLRRERAAERLTDRAATDAAAAPDPPDAQAALEAREIDDAVARALAELPERRRVAMTLRWKHQLGAPEIAQVLGTTPEAVRVLLTRARHELAALLHLARG